MQWLHEEKLILPDAPYPWVGTQRSVILTTIKKVSIKIIKYFTGEHIPVYSTPNIA